MVSEQNKRDFTRTQVKTEVRMTFTDGRSLQGTLHDISMNGVFLKTPTAPDSDLLARVGEVQINLPGATPSIQIKAQGKLVRVSADGAAVEFTGIDEDSFAHLKNLVTYNAADISDVEDELEDSLGLRRRGETFGDF